jgi:hypothetical protein
MDNSLRKWGWSLNLLSNRMKTTEDILYFIAIWGVALLALALVVQYTQYKSFFLVRPAIEVKEPFQGAPESVRGVTEASTDLDSIQPADADLENLSRPYHLLRGVLPDATRDKTSGLSAQRCFETDFNRRIEKTGNYKQLTNNYKRLNPDSCTSPMTELVTSFYSVTPLPAA